MHRPIDPLGGDGHGAGGGGGGGCPRPPRPTQPSTGRQVYAEVFCVPVQHRTVLPSVREAIEAKATTFVFVVAAAAAAAAVAFVVVLKLYSVQRGSEQHKLAHSCTVVIGLPMGLVSFGTRPQHSCPSRTAGNVAVRFSQGSASTSLTRAEAEAATQETTTAAHIFSIRPLMIFSVVFLCLPFFFFFFCKFLAL